MNCSWCRTVRRRDTNEPIAEPLQSQLRQEIETHGMCSMCATDARSALDMRREGPGEASAEEIKNG